MRFSFSVTCVLVLLGVFGGCPQPPAYIDFQVGSQTKNRLKLDLADGDVRMSLLGRGAASSGGGRYRISLSVSVEYPRIPGQLQFDPWKIEVFLNDLPMSKLTEFISPGTYRAEEDYYYVNVMFWEPAYDGVPPFLETVDGEIRIVLDDFILMNGRPLAIDTVLALDPDMR